MREHFRWTSGEENLLAYESSPGKLRRFCSDAARTWWPSARRNRM
jgi:hypothetical protein